MVRKVSTETYMRPLLATWILVGAAWAGGPPLWLSAPDVERLSWSPAWLVLASPDDAVVQAQFEADLAKAIALDVAEQHAQDAENAEEEMAASESPPPPKTVLEPAQLKPSRSVSIGKPNAGWLVRAERLPGTKRIKTRSHTNYGTEEAVVAISDAVDAVHAKFPKTSRLFVGDLSGKGGGRLKRHLSHQSGRDADIGYFFKKDQPDRFKRARAKSLDAARTWVMLESMLADDKIEIAFIDYRLQKPLYIYARDVAKIDANELARVFQYPNGRRYRESVLRHLRGHADHMHIRFRAPRALAAATAYIKKYGTGALKPLPRYYKVRRGDSLWRISRKFRVKIKHLTKWNGIRRKKTLRPGMKLVIGWRRPKLPGGDT